MRTMKRVSLLVGALVLTGVAGSRARAQLPMIREAEDCEVTCREGSAMQENYWARGGKVTPAFWGKAAGDSVAWPVTLKMAHQGLRFGLRYSYAGASFEAHFPHNPKRELRLVVDNRPAITLRVPATGSWDQFDTVAVDLPRLSAGAHVLKVVSPEAEIVANIDTLMLFKGALAKLPVSLRKTIVAVAPTKHFLIRATPNAPFPVPAAKVVEEFETIHAHYAEAMGWAPPEAIGINLIEQARWPDPGATAFQNQGGVYFRAEGMASDQGNWLHEMTHMFYLGHFPRWFDEPSVRALTTLVWAPALYPTTADVMTGPVYTRTRAAGQAVWDNPTATYDSVEPILDALIVRYGEGVFKSFFHECMAAGKRGEMDFTPGRWLTKGEIVRYMSTAAGQDVGPLFVRWRGFAAEP